MLSASVHTVCTQVVLLWYCMLRVLNIGYMGGTYSVTAPIGGLMRCTSRIVAFDH